MSVSVAVIGSGAAAFGVLEALGHSARETSIQLFEVGQEVTPAVPVDSNPACWPASRSSRLYRHLRHQHGLSFPPPKTHFGTAIGRHDVDGKPRVWNSSFHGGLTNFWGGSMFPYTRREMRGWPFGPEALQTGYGAIAEAVGIAGANDRLSEYFGSEYVNRPPPRMFRRMAGLSDALNGTGRAGERKLHAGVNRIALETREGHQQACVYCGQCMIGCFRNSVFSTSRPIARSVESGRVHARIRGKVVSIEPDRSIVAETETGLERSRPFDRIYLCAGALGTAEIVMRSFGMRDGPLLKDSAVVTFPILYLGLDRGAEDVSEYLSLTNLVVILETDDEGRASSQVQIYPSFDYLWRYFVPPQLWPLVNWGGRVLRSRLFWARAYLDERYSQEYALSLSHDGVLGLHESRPSNTKAEVDRIRKALRSRLKGTSYSVPAGPAVVQVSSSHYAGTVPYGGAGLSLPLTGELRPGVYVCDSACFPSNPPISPTFTIMANAYRTALDSLRN